MGKYFKDYFGFDHDMQEFKKKWLMHYKTEYVPCFCGEMEATKIREADRHGYPHIMVICGNCGLVRANPRMTEESNRRFYEEDYYDAYGERDTDLVAAFQENSNLKRGDFAVIRKFIANPRIVYDIGCDVGGFLYIYKIEEGSDVYGCDYNTERAETAKTYIPNANIYIGGMETLEDAPEPSVILLSEVVEHFLDIEGELAGVRELMGERTLLYVSTPNAIQEQPGIFLQNAHQWFFTEKTLKYVMECCGFEMLGMEIIGKSRFIGSVWRKSDKFRKKEWVRNGESIRVRESFDYLIPNQKGKTKLPTILTFNKFPILLRKRYIKQNCELLGSGWIKDVSHLLNTHNRWYQCGIIIAAGPSIEEFTNKILRLRQATDSVIICLDKMADWCEDHYIYPDYVIGMDASDDVINSYLRPKEYTKYILSAQIPPAVADKMKYYDTYLFNTPQRGVDLATMWMTSGINRVSVVNAGGSGTLGAIAFSTMLGLKRLHIFGFDLHFNSGKQYPDGLPSCTQKYDIMEIQIGKRMFKTTASYISFAQQFGQMIQHSKQYVTVYGDSMIVPMYGGK